MENIKNEELSQNVEVAQNNQPTQSVENKKFNAREAATNDNTKFSFIALALAAFVLLVTLLTTFIATPTFLNHFETTIAAWNLPLIIVGLLVFAAVTEKQDKQARFYRLLAIAGLVASFLFTNLTKNVVQDAASNISNYVDVATATMEKEYDNFSDYQHEFEKTAREISKKNMKSRDYDDYDDYDW